MVAQRAEQVRERIGQIALDDAFPERPVEFVHDLHLNERLTLASVADLADRLPRESVPPCARTVSRTSTRAFGGGT